LPSVILRKALRQHNIFHDEKVAFSAIEAWGGLGWDYEV
jgi:hypothetical protein